MVPITTLLIVEAIQCCPDGWVVMTNGDMATQTPVKKNRSKTKLPGGISRLIASPVRITHPSYSSSDQLAGRVVGYCPPGGAKTSRRREPLQVSPGSGQDRSVATPGPRAPKPTPGPLLEPVGAAGPRVCRQRGKHPAAGRKRKQSPPRPP